jgi:acetylornithine/N-succinyldiaminopimelate aminotransferase
MQVGFGGGDILTGNQITEMGKKYLMQNYAQLPLVIARGEGVRVWDDQGKCYLDFVGGIAVNSVGHCHPRVVAAIRQQSEQLIHCSNLYWFEPPVVLARELTALSGLDRVFFIFKLLEQIAPWFPTLSDLNKKKQLKSLKSF